MTRYLSLGFLIISFLSLVGCTSGPLGWYYAPAIAQMRDDLPVGTPLWKVEAYLDQHNIDYSYFGHRREINATVRNVRRDALVQADQSLVFRFDAAKRLTDIQADPGYTRS